jgi:hypothetical protein
MECMFWVAAMYIFPRALLSDVFVLGILPLCLSFSALYMIPSVHSFNLLLCAGIFVRCCCVMSTTAMLRKDQFAWNVWSGWLQNMMLQGSRA